MQSHTYTPYVIITQYHASIDRIFYDFSVTRIVRIIRANNYEKLSKFVTAKILSVISSAHAV